MNIKITGRDLKATDAIKEYAEKKAERLQKYFEEDFDVVVTIKVEKKEQVAEMRVTAKGDTYKAVTAHKDLYASLDKDIDILEGQIRKFKTKKERMNKEISIKEKEMQAIPSNNIENEIIKELYYEIKPMDPEDAKLKLQERKGDIFLPFINVATGKVSVIYRLKDSNNYGLVEPEGIKREGDLSFLMKNKRIRE